MRPEGGIYSRSVRHFDPPMQQAIIIIIIIIVVSVQVIIVVYYTFSGLCAPGPGVLKLSEGKGPRM